MHEVRWSHRAERQVAKLPTHIAERLQIWVEAVEWLGLREVRKRPGLHDEPLAGRRFGQRSARLNRAYRVIYKEHAGWIEILEVSKHEY